MIIFHDQKALSLKVVSATFMLVCFLSLNENTFQTSLNNLGSKYSLLMKFGQLMSILQKKKIHQNFLQKLQPEN